LFVDVVCWELGSHGILIHILASAEKHHFFAVVKELDSLVLNLVVKREVLLLPTTLSYKSYKLPKKVYYESLLVINRQSFAEIRFYEQLHWDIPVLAETLSELRCKLF